MLLRKNDLKICSKITGEHPCRSVVSVKLLCNLIEITPQHGCFPINLLDIFRTLFLKNTSGRSLLESEINVGFVGVLMWLKIIESGSAVTA